jgi:hypothetical protein
VVCCDFQTGPRIMNPFDGVTLDIVVAGFAVADTDCESAVVG